MTVKCALCPETDELLKLRFEAHHIYGRKHSSEIIPLCPNCHAKITKRQNELSPKIRAQKLNRDQLIFACTSALGLAEVAIRNSQTFVKQLTEETTNEPKDRS